ncbi:chemotaxis protein CheA [Thermodesulfobacteriota bacterium]
MNTDDETLQIFIAESEDLLKTTEESLLRLEVVTEPGPELEELFRAVHTLKSSTALVGFDTISGYVHLLENLLERIRNNQLQVTRSLISFLLEDVDFIHKMVGQSIKGELNSDPDTLAILEDRKNMVNRFLGVGGIAPDSETLPKRTLVAGKGEEENYYHIDLRFQKDIFNYGQDPILLLLNLAECGEYVEVSADIADLPPYEEMVIYTMYLSWRIVLKTALPLQEIEDVFIFVSEENDIKITDVTSRFREGIDLEVGDMSLGEILVERGGVSGEDMGKALNKQKKLGEILVEDGIITDHEVQGLVHKQEESRAVYRKSSVRVDVEKIDYLVNLAGEISIFISKMQNLLAGEEEAAEGNFELELENLFKVNYEFQERVARIRMFPLEGTFRRFHRVARDTAYSQQKKIKIIQSGMDVELNKEVIESINDPLKHIVRNCVDHGIELPEERIAAGKPEEGTIEIRAYRQGGKIYIQVCDDGHGFQVEDIRKRALEMGLAESTDRFDNKTLMKYVCHPGFSMASRVTELSGRGVGLDVVKTEVERLGGEFLIESEEGKGTTFTLALPVTFALSETLQVRTNELSYLLPLKGVMGVETFYPERSKNFGGNEKVYLFRGEYLPIVDLPAIQDKAEPAESRSEQVMVFLNTGSHKFGVMVDEILDPQQVVVKSLESNFRSVKGLAGATIMGDGTIALVLDLFFLEDFFFKQECA